MKMSHVWHTASISRHVIPLAIAKNEDLILKSLLNTAQLLCLYYRSSS